MVERLLKNCYTIIKRMLKDG